MAVVESAIRHPIKSQQKHDVDEEIAWRITLSRTNAPNLEYLNLYDVVGAKQHVANAEQDGDGGQDLLLFPQVSTQFLLHFVQDEGGLPYQ